MPLVLTTLFNWLPTLKNLTLGKIAQIVAALLVVAALSFGGCAIKKMSRLEAENAAQQLELRRASAVISKIQKDLVLKEKLAKQYAAKRLFVERELSETRKLIEGLLDGQSKAWRETTVPDNVRKLLRERTTPAN